MFTKLISWLFRLMQKLAIWVFRLHDLKALLKQEREKQNEYNSRKNKRELSALADKHAMELSYQAQSYEAQISILESELEAVAKKKKHLEQLEFRLKKQVKRNLSVATIAYSHVFNIAEFLNKEAAEIHKLIERTEKNQNLIGR